MSEDRRLIDAIAERVKPEQEADSLFIILEFSDSLVATDLNKIAQKILKARGNDAVLKNTGLSVRDVNTDAAITNLIEIQLRSTNVNIQQVDDLREMMSSIDGYRNMIISTTKATNITRLTQKR